MSLGSLGERLEASATHQSSTSSRNPRSTTHTSASSSTFRRSAGSRTSDERGGDPDSTHTAEKSSRSSFQSNAHAASRSTTTNTSMPPAGSPPPPRSSPTSSSRSAPSSSPTSDTSYRAFDLDDFGFMSEAEKREKAIAEGRLPDGEDSSATRLADGEPSDSNNDEPTATAATPEAPPEHPKDSNADGMSSFAQSFYSSTSSSQSEYPTLSPDSQDFATPSQPASQSSQEPDRVRTPAEVRAAIRAKSRGMKAFRKSTGAAGSSSSRTPGFRPPAFLRPPVPPSSATGASQSSAFSQNRSSQSSNNSSSSSPSAPAARTKRKLDFLMNGAKAAYKPSVFSKHRDFGYLRNDEPVETKPSVDPFKRYIDLKRKDGSSYRRNPAKASKGGLFASNGWFSKSQNRRFGGGLFEDEKLNVKFSLTNLSREMQQEMEQRETVRIGLCRMLILKFFSCSSFLGRPCFFSLGSHSHSARRPK